MHDVADPATDRLMTFPVPGSLTAATRAARLRQLGYAADAAVFATALHELTPKAPFQASPRAWLDAFDGTYSTGTSVAQVLVAAARDVRDHVHAAASTWPSRASGRGLRS